MGSKRRAKDNKPALKDGVKSRFASRGVTLAEGTQSGDAPSVAAALGELMEPYAGPDASAGQHELVLAVAVLAWNCSLLSEDEAFREVRAVQENLDAEEQGELLEIMAAMQVRKEELFPWGNQTIIDAQLEPARDGTLKLSVALAVKED